MKTRDTYLDEKGNRTDDIEKTVRVIREEFSDEGELLVRRVLDRAKD